MGARLAAHQFDVHQSKPASCARLVLRRSEGKGEHGAGRLVTGGTREIGAASGSTLSINSGQYMI